MKYFSRLLLILALILTSISFGQNDCKKYRNGTFKYVDKDSGNVFLIKRKGNIQYEEIEGEAEVYAFHVKWISDCMYTLYPTKETLERNKEFGGYLYVEITDIREKSIVLRSTMKEHPEMIIYSEVTILE